MQKVQRQGRLQSWLNQWLDYVIKDPPSSCAQLCLSHGGLSTWDKTPQDRTRQLQQDQVLQEDTEGPNEERDHLSMCLLLKREEIFPETFEDFPSYLKILGLDTCAFIKKSPVRAKGFQAEGNLLRCHLFQRGSHYSGVMDISLEEERFWESLIAKFLKISTLSNLKFFSTFNVQKESLMESNQVISYYSFCISNVFQTKLTKIYKFNSAFSSQQNVISFYITMDSFVVMQMLKSLEGGNI